MNQSVSDALLKEKMAVSADQRKADMREREILMSQGNVLSRPTDYENDSILLKEQKCKSRSKRLWLRCRINLRMQN